MAKIVNVTKEEMPKVKLIGKKYGNEDRNQYGSFGDLWKEWFKSGMDGLYAECTEVSGINGSYVGAMNFNNGQFEYWIGKLWDVNSSVPEGMEAVEIEASDVGVCYLYGKDQTVEIYGKDAHDACIDRLVADGYKIAENGWVMERYDNERFMNKDEQGNIILDYCVYLQK